MRTAFLLFCLLIRGCAATAPDSVIAQLEHITLFSFGGVGFAGTKAPGERDFSDIMARSTARADFEQVFANGSTEAKLYALTALHKLDLAKYNALASPLRNSTQDVHVAMGCVISNRHLGDLIRTIEAGGYSVYLK